MIQILRCVHRPIGPR